MPLATEFYKEKELIFEEIYSDRIIDLTGLTFNRLTVLGFAGRFNKKTRWYCKCKCSRIIEIDSQSLKDNHTQSCGCLHEEKSAEHLTTHDKSRSNEYKVYLSAKNRCINSNNQMYDRYGKRGIEFNFNSFEEFYQHIGPRPSKEYSLDRKNNLGNYEIGNVRWVKQKIQANNKRKNFILEVKGIEKTLAEWCEGSRTELYKLVHTRINNGWCPVCSFLVYYYEKPPENCGHKYHAYCNRKI